VGECFAVVGIAAGVALLFASQVSSQSLQSSVGQLSHGIVGSATLQLLARDPHGFPESTLTRVRQIPGVRAAAPLLEANANAIGPAGSKSIELVGAQESLDQLGGSLVHRLALETFGGVGGIVLTAPLARRIGVTKFGKDVTLELGGHTERAPLYETVSAQRIGPLAASPVAVAPLEYVQEMTGLQGRVSRILVAPRSGAENQVRAALSAVAGGRLNVQSTDYDEKLFSKAATAANQSTQLFAVISALVGLAVGLGAAASVGDRSTNRSYATDTPGPTAAGEREPSHGARARRRLADPVAGARRRTPPAYRPGTAVANPNPMVFRIAGLSTNVGWVPGAIIMNATNYAHAWASQDVSAYNVVLTQGTSPAVAAREITAALGGGRGTITGLSAQTAQTHTAKQIALSRQALANLSQIATLILIVAILAMAAAIGAMVWQRRPRLAKLKLEGLPRTQLWHTILLESLIVLGAGCVTGAVFGLYGQQLADRALADTVNFPIVYSITALSALWSLALVTAAALAILALPGYLAASVPAALALQD
jgi:ABC-type lipoprotein release transport system permease subunit